MAPSHGLSVASLKSEELLQGYIMIDVGVLGQHDAPRHHLEAITRQWILEASVGSILVPIGSPKSLGLTAFSTRVLLLAPGFSHGSFG